MVKNPVAWFEIYVDDIERAEKFYNAVFGYEFARQPEKDGMHMSWFPMDMEKDAPRVSGSLTQMEGYGPNKNGGGTVVYFTVADIDATLKKVEEAGSKITIPKTDIGEHGVFAWALDSEGNTIAIHSDNK